MVHNMQKLRDNIKKIMEHNAEESYKKRMPISNSTKKIYKENLSKSFSKR